MEKPKIKQPTKEHLEKLSELCNKYINYLDDDEEYHEDGLRNRHHYIFESALECFFGKDVWDWVNERRD